jgi:hypothetical protein
MTAIERERDVAPIVSRALQLRFHMFVDGVADVFFQCVGGISIQRAEPLFATWSWMGMRCAMVCVGVMDRLWPISGGRECSTPFGDRSFCEVVHVDVGAIEHVPRARTPVRVPVVLSREEVARVMTRVTGTPWIIVALLLAPASGSWNASSCA